MTVKPDERPPIITEPLKVGDSVFDLANHTPMMVQYLTMKANYPQALLLYRMGDFYELFFDDAKRAAHILDITLTRRGNDKAGNTIAMAGVPFHAADSYMARLIAAGETVVVCEQIDESTSTTVPMIGDKQNKDTSKIAANTIMRREVVKTLTAGTITDDALIAPNHTPTVVAIDVCLPNVTSTRKTGQPLQAGISQLDLAAGTLTTQALNPNHHDIEALQAQILTVLARFAPSECIVSETLDETWLLWLRTHLDCPIIEVAAADFHREHASATLCRQFDVQRLDGLGISDALLSQSSCAALIHYAKQTQQRHIPQVNRLIVEHDDDYLIIDANSQQNLELFAPVSHQGTALISVLNECQTPMGKRLLLQQMKRPLRQHDRITQRLDAIDSLLTAVIPHSSNHASNHASNDSLVSQLRERLETIGDVERISSRIALMTAKPRDLRKLAEAIANSHKLSLSLNEAGIQQEQAGLLALLMQHLPAQLTVLQEIADLIARAIVIEPPAHIRDGGMLAAGYDDTFDRLTHLHDNIQATLDEMATHTKQEYQLPSLKVGFNKVSGFYFELPKMQAQQAPAHFVRRQTLKNSERFITEALKDVETEYLSAQTLALGREKELYQQLLATLGQDLTALQQLSAAIAQIDVLSNWAQLASTYHWQRPTFGDQLALTTADLNDTDANVSINANANANVDNNAHHRASIDIQKGRHAVVEAALSHHKGQSQQPSHAFVANDCQLGSTAHPERLLMITGPNMGGKSTYMRQTALIVYLAHCGSFVPAARAHLGTIDRIFTRIGSADDLAGGKSTFMVEMIETANILNQATDQSLVLMDEVGRGTATTDGLAIAHACVNRLQEIGCLTLFATHYFELTQLAQDTASIRNVHVAASEVDGQLLLLHQIHAGAASSSFGLHVAKMAGIPSRVLAEAKRYLVETLTPVQTHAFDDKKDLAKSLTDKPPAPAVDKATPPHQALSVEEASSSLLLAKNIQQNQLFSLQHELDAIDPDSLTPKQAHDLLYHLKQLSSR